MFDPIYTDLESFWGQDPVFLRQFANEWSEVITVRNNVAKHRGQTPHLWIGYWLNMLQAIPEMPDVDLPVIIEDEPRVMVDFKRLQSYMDKAATSRQMHQLLPNDEVRNEFIIRPEHTEPVPEAFNRPESGLANVGDRSMWDFVLAACRPDDPVLDGKHEVPEQSVPPLFSSNYTAGTIQGYVLNYTTARNPCQNPNVKTLHGQMISTARTVMYTDLVPLFGVCKVAGVSNDILLPIPTNWLRHGAYLELDYTIPWQDKKAQAVWRGSATGWHNHTNWWGFQRFRLVAMLNATLVSLIENEHSDQNSATQYPHPQPNLTYYSTHNIAYPLKHLFNIAAQSYDKLGAWTRKIGDAGFTHLSCAPWRALEKPNVCPYSDNFYGTVDFMNEDGVMHHKYLPDVDGMSASGRCLSFISSLSGPIKSTIYQEWHDSRLIPWKHFVPMSIEMQEWWGLMEYFIGYDGVDGEKSVDGHDEIGEKIGRQGSQWARGVERREDMVVYFYRLILEYARLCADDRVMLGYVEDLS